MATAGPVIVGSGNQSPASISRTVERILDEAQHTGEINLGGRKLKNFPSAAIKYDLLDTTVADLSKNRFSEIPETICDFVSIERLNCYHNVIKCLPRAIVQLKSLVYLNLSRNQLSSLPPSISQLDELRVLLVSNNRLLSLPDEITELRNLTELDVSCNELSNLPSQVCRLLGLRSLNLRRNLLLQLPFGVLQLKLRKLDVSSNRIAHIPLDLHKMTTLEELYLENNPLQTPPSSISTRGLVHIMKYLSNELHPGDKKILQNEVRLRNRIKRSMSLSTTSPDNPGLWWNASSRDKVRQTSTVDSGYSTTNEGSDKSHWSSSEVSPISPDDLGSSLPSARPTTSNTNKPSQKVAKATASNSNSPATGESSKATLQSKSSTKSAKPASSEARPSCQQPASSSSPADAISMELERQKAEYAARKKKAEELKAMLDADNERRRQMSKEKDKELPESCQNGNIAMNAKTNAKEKASTLPARASADILAAFSRDSFNTPASAPCQNTPNTRSLWEQYNNSVKLDPQMDAICAETTKRIQKLEERLKTDNSILKVTTSPSVNGTIHSSNADAAGKKTSTKEGSATPKSTVSRTTTRTVSAATKPTSHGPVTTTVTTVTTTNTVTAASSASPSSAAATQKVLERLDKEIAELEISKTINSKQTPAETENDETTKELRKLIESKLKIKLPQDVGEALQDGVILCHLANHLRPRSIMCIHIPSPAVPKLSQAKCRRNVDNFLLACRRMGLDQSRICSSSVILEKKGIVAVTEMIRAMVDSSSKLKQTAAV